MTAPPAKPTVDQVVPLVHAYYQLPDNGVGGSLHIVLSDGNLDRADVAYCLEWARRRDDLEGVVLAELLARMSRTQRGKVYGRHRGGVVPAAADFWTLARPLIFDWLTEPGPLGIERQDHGVGAWCEGKIRLMPGSTS